MTTPKIKFSGGDYHPEHFRFVRKTDCQPWHFPAERPPLAPQGDTLFDRFLAVLTIIGFVVFLFWALGQGV